MSGQQRESETHKSSDMHVSQVSIDGIEIRLRPMNEAPKDGTPILVLLEKESLGMVWHSARIRPNVSFVGHRFAFDCPKMIGWISFPVVPQ